MPGDSSPEHPLCAVPFSPKFCPKNSISMNSNFCLLNSVGPLDPVWLPCPQLLCGCCLRTVSLAIMGLPLVFPSLTDYSLVLPAVQCLKQLFRAFCPAF